MRRNTRRKIIKLCVKEYVRYTKDGKASGFGVLPVAQCGYANTPIHDPARKGTKARKSGMIPKRKDLKKDALLLLPKAAPPHKPCENISILI